MSFVKPFGGANPLPQILTVASAGANFNFTVAASTSAGGDWLSVATGSGCGLCATPESVAVIVNAGAAMAAGNYPGQVVITSQGGATSITVSVSLTVAAASATFFDNLPGQMSFALKTAGGALTSQDLQVRNAGSGTLNWTLTGSTADGGNWLQISTPNGTAPSVATVGVTVANLPGGGLVAGTFIGQLVFQGGGSTVTVPVSVVVGDNVFNQINAINFTKPFGGADPLPQTLTVASTGTEFNFKVASYTATGGNWLSVATGSGCGLCSTPQSVTAIVAAGAAMAAGSYTGQIVITSQFGNLSITVPVTLTIAPSGGTFFDNLPGQLSFSLKTGGGTITSQDIQVRNAGSGTLNWTVTASTADAGSWLSVSSSSGTAPSIVTVRISVANLPSGGLIAGTFIGQLVFQTAAGRVTVPISVVVGAAVFSQVNGIDFTKPFGGADPLPQTITIGSTGTDFNFKVASYTATGGSWLSATTGSGCGLCSTPQSIIATVNASPALAAGTYTGQIVVTSQFGNLVITVPVTLTVAATTGPFFDNLPGQLSFSLKTGGGAITSQDIQIRNGGPGSLSWTVTGSTADGGNWLTISTSSGTAPSIVTVGVSVANLPNAGLVAGTFVGQVVLQSAGGSVTIPVSVVVGDNILRQVNGIDFTMPAAGANPLPQTLTISSTGTDFNFKATSSTATGGNWLSIATGSGCGLCSTSQTIVATITASPTLAAGTYTGQIVVTSQFGTMSITVPVTLTVGALSGPFFDNLPGQVSFSIQTGGAAPPSQPVQIRNGGSGTLNWTLTTATSDGGNWLTVSAAGGTAPSTVSVSVATGSLPGLGLVAGTFTGELVFHAPGSRITIPVSVTVGANVFAQLSGLSFTKPFGGANPLSQALNITSTGTNFNFKFASSTGTGGAWLSVTSAGGCGLCATPKVLTAAIVANAALVAGTYTGQVVATEQFGSMAMTIPITLTVTGVGLPAPVLTSPANGATGVSLTPTLSWTASTGAASYDVYFGSTANPAILANTAQTSYAVPALNPNTTYFWRVVAKNSSGSTTSATFSFTTQTSPMPVSTNPASGSLLTDTFMFTFTNPSGAQNLGPVDILINNFLDGRNACYVAYVRATPTSGSVFLVDDQGDAGGPYAGLVLPSGNSVQNSQCSINGTGSSVLENGNTLTLTLVITFKAAFAGDKVIYMSAQDVAFNNSGWRALGTRNIPGTAPVGPAVTGMTPARTNGTGQVYTFNFTDSNGFADLSVLNVLVNSAIDGRHACYLAFVPSGPNSGAVDLVDDAGDAGGPYSGMQLPGNGSVQNNQCSIAGQGSSVTSTGNTLTLSLNITFNPAAYGSEVFYVAARNNNGGNSDWHAVGSVTVPLNQ